MIDAEANRTLQFTGLDSGAGQLGATMVKVWG